jgi:hypothetical protein
VDGVDNTENPNDATELASDEPAVAKNLSAELFAALRAVENGDSPELAANLMVEAAAVVNAFAAAGLIEFAYIPPEEIGGEDDVAVFGVSEAAIIEDAPDVISLFGYLDRSTDPLPVLAYESGSEDEASA